MRNRIPKALLVAGVCLAVGPSAWAGTMRCGSRVVSAGESMAVVRAFCGRPTVVQHGLMASATTVRVAGHPLSQSHTVGAEVPVETWTYNRGPKKLMMRIRFVNGEVVAVKTLHEYGY